MSEQPPEEWRTVAEVPWYEVSNFGRVRSITAYNILAQRQRFSGKKHYMVVELGVRNKGRRKFMVHRLVALAFLPADPDRPFVNHIDADKHNNNLSNLQWVSSAENAAHARDMGLLRPKTKAVIQLDPITGRTLARFSSSIAAARSVGVSPGGISSVCTGWRTDSSRKRPRRPRITAGGYRWAYAPEATS